MVNTFLDSDQFEPDVVATKAGEFVVVWTSLGQDDDSGGLAGVFGQHWAGDGTKLGTEFQVNTFVAGSQYEPSIAANRAGDVASSWISFGQDGDAHGVFAQRFTATLEPIGPELPANSYVVGAQNHPDISVSPDGTFVVTWESRRPINSDGLEIVARRYSAEGVALTSEFQVNTSTAKAQRFPKVAHDAAGNFLIVWRGGATFDAPDDPDGSGAGIFARAYDSAGLPRGPDFVVPIHTPLAQFSPAVAGRRDAGFVVAWGGYGKSDAGLTSDGVFSMAISSDGMRMQEVDTFLGFSASEGDEWISASALENDLQVIAWDKREVFDGPALVAGRLQSPVGGTIGNEMILAERESSGLQQVQLASYGAAGFVAVWTDLGDTPIDGSGSAVCARMFDAFAECGDVSHDGKVSTADALAVLRVAVGESQCIPCECDVDASQEIAATDALRVLRASVGLCELACPECS